MGGVAARLSLGGADAMVLDTPSNLIKTANREGAATSGSSTGALFKRARSECKRVKSSAEGTGVTVANDECMPFGGKHVAPEAPHVGIAAPKSAPASSTDCGI